MRKLLILMLILSSGILHAQESINNFKIDNNEIIWQKIYNTSLLSDSTLSFEELVQNLKYSLILENVEISNNEIFGSVKEFDALYEEAGYSEMTCSIYIVRSHFNAIAIINYKDGKYRVTIKKIELIQAYTDPLSQLGEKTSLNSFALRNDNTEIRPAFKKSPSIILDYTFTKMFRFENRMNDNW